MNCNSTLVVAVVCACAILGSASQGIAATYNFVNTGLNYGSTAFGINASGQVAGVALGLPILDPLIGLAITVAILFVAKDTALAIWHRLLDGIEPELLAEMEHAPLHVPGVIEVHEVRGRWLGHRLHAELHITVDAQLSVGQAHEIVEHVNAALAWHLPSFGGAHIHVCPTLQQQGLT